MGTVTITATGPRQQEALNWMLGKAMPEGYESVGLTLDEEWAMFVVSDVTDHRKGLTKEVVLKAEHVEPFAAECEDGVRILQGIAHDWQDPETRAVARALRRIAERAREEAST